MNRTRRAGFSLIELLVVIAMIAVLVAMLVPAMGNAKRKAKDLKCAVDIRTLLNTTLSYASGNDGYLPDLSRNGPAPDAATADSFYWTWVTWRDLFVNEYGLQREQFYGATNSKWNRDDFWDWPGGTRTVMGRFYFANPRLNTDAVMNRLAIKPDDLKLPLFPSRLGNQAYYTQVWSDLNRQWPAGPGNNFVTPGDPLRWGSNHLYPGNSWPDGSHVGYQDGGVRWTHGSEIQFRLSQGAEIFW